MPNVVAPLAIRIYEPVALSFPASAPSMPSRDAAVPAPKCLLCRRASTLPPARAVWISSAGGETLAIVCAPCDHECGDEAALEQRILAQLTPKADVQTPAPTAQPFPQEAAAPAAHETRAMPGLPWVEAAAKAWVRPTPAT